MSGSAAIGLLGGGTGHVVGLAIDHVASLAAVLADGDPSAFKAAVVSRVGPSATTVLVDETHAGLARALATDATSGDGPGPATMLGLGDDDPAAAVARLVAAGATVVKGHLMCDDGGAVTRSQDDRVRAWGDACRSSGVPFLFEPLVPGTGDRSLAVARVAAHFAADRFVVDVLKLQVPLDGTEPATPADHRRAHAAVDEAAGGRPHVFLSGGVAGLDRFVDLVAAAGDAGSRSCGVVVGRAVWGDAAATPSSRRAGALDAMAHRFARIADVVHDALPGGSS